MTDMKRIIRNKSLYHPNYDEYVEMIVSHPAYRGLYYNRKNDGRVNWVVTGKSREGQLRLQWWKEKCKEHNIPIQKGCYAKLARQIHPTGWHVCQCCGEARSIFYEYPTKRTVQTLNKILGTNIDKDNDEERAEYTIREIIEIWCHTQSQTESLAKAFGLPKPKDKQELIDLIYAELVSKENGRFSPGVMCNPPDRFNGFHSYALCCRTKFDTGRKNENMQTYMQDRRAYEDWADGNYNLANRLMGEFRKQPPITCPICGETAKMSADHIGPISLGFCHSTHFAAMCRKCNSAKNNRFTKADVKKLITLEKNGEQVISWHSKYIWDNLKYKVKNDNDAKAASLLMAKCHQNILNIFSLIYANNGREFLMRYLNPDYSMMDYRFDNFDLFHLDNTIIVATPLDSKNKRNNQERYIRIAFESLAAFHSKTNRRNELLVNEHSPVLKSILTLIKDKAYDSADKALIELIKQLSKQISDEAHF